MGISALFLFFADKLKMAHTCYPDQSIPNGGYSFWSVVRVLPYYCPEYILIGIFPTKKEAIKVKEMVKGDDLIVRSHSSTFKPKPGRVVYCVREAAENQGE